MGLRRKILALTTLATLLTTAFAADRTAPRQPPKQSSAPTLQVYSRETFVDITVLDAKGHPVHGLKPSDFIILEDGQEMKPKSFAEHRADTQPNQSTSATPTKLDLPPNIFTNIAPVPAKPGPLNILLIDSLNTGTQAQQFVTQRMLDYIDKMPPDSRFEVLRLTTTLSIVQGFTSDREVLKAAVSNKKNLWMEPPFADPGSEKGLQAPVIEDPGAIVDKEGSASAMRGQLEMVAMRQLARYLSGMPGRKNLIWFAGSFPLQFPPVYDPIIFPPPNLTALVRTGIDPANVPVPQAYDFEDEMKSVADMLTRSHVAVYPIDSRGLEVIPFGPKKGLSGLSNIGAMRLGEHETMDLIADRTGGKAFYNTNGLAEAMAEAIDNGSNFYTLTYVPTNEKLDTRFRKITVKVNQPNLHLTYREGYYAVDPSIDARGKKVLPNATAMQTALLRGALEPTQILFKVKATPVAATEVSLPANNQIDAKHMKPPYRRLAIDYATDITNITFTPTPDGYHANFEFSILVYDADGQIINSATTEFHPTLPTARYQSMLKTGLNSRQEIAVPVKGDYFLRIAVHDLTSDHVGAIEIPTTAITTQPIPAVASGK